jgi:hypothetical protein
MKLARNQKGYILPLTIIIVFAMTFLVTRLVTRAYANVQVNRRVIEREKAKELALGGLTIVQAQLTYKPEQQKKTAPQSEPTTEKKETFVEKLLQIINRWQTVTLTEKAYGFDGTVQLYVSCEEGKLPLNALWDFKNKKFIKKDSLDVRKLIENVMLKRAGAKSGEKQLVEELEKFLKKQKEPLEDLSQLFENEYFKGLASTFYLQPETASQEDKVKNAGLALSDIFTVAHDSLNLQPLFLSSGLHTLFDFKQLPVDDKQRKEITKTLAQKLSKAVKSPEEIKVEWKTEWDSMLAKIYGKSYDKVLSELKTVFSTSVGATQISVLSYGTVGSVTQKVYAILQRVVLPDKRVTYVIKKLYWL